MGEGIDNKEFHAGALRFIDCVDIFLGPEGRSDIDFAELSDSHIADLLIDEQISGAVFGIDDADSIPNLRVRPIGMVCVDKTIGEQERAHRFAAAGDAADAKLDAYLRFSRFTDCQGKIPPSQILFFNNKGNIFGTVFSLSENFL